VGVERWSVVREVEAGFVLSKVADGWATTVLLVPKWELENGAEGEWDRGVANLRGDAEATGDNVRY